MVLYIVLYIKSKIYQFYKKIHKESVICYYVDRETYYMVLYDLVL
uniref:Uncharacterized protein n=1 Tax=viral metagenome TaxID=1070528 RepID=A0A6C0DME5_9ZZZZ